VINFFVVQKLKTLPVLNCGGHYGRRTHFPSASVNGNMFGNFIKCRD
jgi:hypothetical protein